MLFFLQLKILFYVRKIILIDPKNVYNYIFIDIKIK